MFPSFSIFGIDLYQIMIVIGFLFAIITFRFLSEKIDIPIKVYNFALLCALASTVLGFFFGAFFQAIYNYLATKNFAFGNGMTFYGGLIGAIVCFLLLYFIIGKAIFKDRSHIKMFAAIVNLLFIAIIIAHAFGRIGCLLVGCCYGKLTDSPLGIVISVNGVKEKRIPVQLYEALFLFLLYGINVFLLLKKRFKYGTSLYFIAYGLWRFGIEFWRDDDRGSTILAILTPSQLSAIIFILVGILTLCIFRRKEVWPHE